MGWTRSRRFQHADSVVSVRMQIDPETMAVYYVNHATKITSWVLPEEDGGAAHIYEAAESSEQVRTVSALNVHGLAAQLSRWQEHADRWHLQATGALTICASPSSRHGQYPSALGFSQNSLLALFLRLMRAESLFAVGSLRICLRDGRARSIRNPTNRTM
eukprot:2881151-Rhodomonas_salina.1